MLQIKLLIDRNIDDKLVDALRMEGFDVISVKEWNKSAKDDEIVEKAEREGRIIVTKDSYFAEKIFKIKPKCSVIFLGFDDPEMIILALKGIADVLDIRGSYIILG